MGVIKTKTPPIIEGCGATGTLIDDWWECVVWYSHFGKLAVSAEAEHMPFL